MFIGRTILGIFLSGGLAALAASLAGAASPAASTSAPDTSLVPSIIPSSVRPIPPSPNLSPSTAQFWFGVAVENIPPVIARQLKLKAEQGLWVLYVQPNSPAQRAGLKVDDLLIELNGAALTSQEELARAANTMKSNKTANSVDVASPLAETSKITLLRGGDRLSLEITPGPRPANMRVAGASQENFTIHPDTTVGNVAAAARGLGRTPEQTEGMLAQPLAVRNYVLSNGVAAQVGPGYRVNLQVVGPNGTLSSGVPAGGGEAGGGAGGGGAKEPPGEADGVTVRSIKRIVDKGQTVIFSQQADDNGVMQYTIGYAGDQIYTVERGKLGSLPADLRPLAEQFLAANPPPPAPSALPSAALAAPTNVASPPPLEDRMNKLEQQNQQLQKQNQDLHQQLSELIGLLKKQQAGK